KHTLGGVIGIVTTGRFPVVIGPTVAYIRLSNIYGSQKVRVDFIHAGTEESLFAFEIISPKEAEPLGVYTLIVPVPPFAVSEAGRYVLRVVSSSNGDLLAQSPIQVQGPSDKGQP